MHASRRAPIGWRTVAAIVGGMSLIGWAVEGVLPWMQATALVFGILFVAYGLAASARPDRTTERADDRGGDNSRTRQT